MIAFLLSENTKGISVVVLGVTLSLTLMFAIIGTIIGVHFHVERILCFCCKRFREGDQTKLKNDSLVTWYGKNKSSSANFYLSAKTVSFFSAWNLCL